MEANDFSKDKTRIFTLIYVVPFFSINFNQSNLIPSKISKTYLLTKCKPQNNTVSYPTGYRPIILSYFLRVCEIYCVYLCTFQGF